MVKRPATAGRPPHEVVADIVHMFEKRGIAQAPGYKAFRFVRTTPASVIVEREGGTTATVPKSDLERAIEFVREDSSVYIDGPGRLRECGITHVNSPTWSLIRLLALNDLIR